MIDFERQSVTTNERLQVTWAISAEDRSGVMIGHPDGEGDITGIIFERNEEFFAFREAINDLYDHIRQEQTTG